MSFARYSFSVTYLPTFFTNITLGINYFFCYLGTSIKYFCPGTLFMPLVNLVNLVNLNMQNDVRPKIYY